MSQNQNGISIHCLSQNTSIFFNLNRAPGQPCLQQHVVGQQRRVGHRHRRRSPHRRDGHNQDAPASQRGPRESGRWRRFNCSLGGILELGGSISNHLKST